MQTLVVEEIKTPDYDIGTSSLTSPRISFWLKHYTEKQLYVRREEDDNETEDNRDVTKGRNRELYPAIKSAQFSQLRECFLLPLHKKTTVR